MCRTAGSRSPSIRNCRTGCGRWRHARASRSPNRRRFDVRVLQFFAVMLTAIAFVPAGGHLFELPNKIGLSEEHYFVAQSIYRGWALFGNVIIAAIAANLTLALTSWRRRRRYWPSLAAALILAGTVLVFFA